MILRCALSTIHMSFPSVAIPCGLSTARGCHEPITFSVAESMTSTRSLAPSSLMIHSGLESTSAAMPRGCALLGNANSPKSAPGLSSDRLHRQHPPQRSVNRVALLSGTALRNDRCDRSATFQFDVHATDMAGIQRHDLKAISASPRNQLR